jgi:hypothetical protein
MDPQNVLAFRPSSGLIRAPRLHSIGWGPGSYFSTLLYTMAMVDTNTRQVIRRAVKCAFHLLLLVSIEFCPPPWVYAKPDLSVPVIGERAITIPINVQVVDGNDGTPVTEEPTRLSTLTSC